MMRWSGDPRREQVIELASPLEAPGDFDPLLDRIGDADIVLIGEASHGTHESIRTVLEGFERWPTWMWANEEVEDFARWLRDHNHDRPPADQVGFYGLDVYSLWESLRVIIDFLDVHDAEAALTARRAWSCLEPYAEDPQPYAWATKVVPTSCEDEVVALLARLQQETEVIGDDAEARSGSLEELLHRSAPEQSLFVFPDRPDQSIDWLDARLGHRTIGVVYRPELERAGQYVPTVLGRRDDAFCFFDTTSALRPVPPEIPQADREQETYPCGT